MAQTLIITGMHRSGTSLLASLLQRAGINIGSRLLGASRGNLRGHFEDADFYEFQDQALRDRGQTFLVCQPFVFEPSQVEMERARALIKEREGRPVWGWKDPRTSLFLDFWHELLPDALFLFVYRHPLDVLLSLIRRGDLENLGSEGVESWFVYNSKIMDFVERNRESTVLSHAYSVTDQFEEFGRILTRKFGLDLHFDGSILNSLYHPEELKRTGLTDDVESVLRNIHPEPLALYDHLNAMADLPFDLKQQHTQSVSDLSSNVTRFSEYVASVPLPHDAARCRSMLLLLISLIDPVSVTSFFEEHTQNVLQLKRHEAALRQEVIALQTNRDEILQVLRQRDSHLSEVTTWTNSLLNELNELRGDRDRVVDLLRLQEDQVRRQAGQLALQEDRARVLNEQLGEKVQCVETLLSENAHLKSDFAAQAARVDELQKELNSVWKDLDALRKTRTVRVSRAVGVAVNQILEIRKLSI